MLSSPNCVRKLAPLPTTTTTTATTPPASARPARWGEEKLPPHEFLKRTGFRCYDCFIRIVFALPGFDRKDHCRIGCIVVDDLMAHRLPIRLLVEIRDLGTRNKKKIPRAFPPKLCPSISSANNNHNNNILFEKQLFRTDLGPGLEGKSNSEVRLAMVSRAGAASAGHASAGRELLRSRVSHDYPRRGKNRISEMGCRKLSRRIF